MTVSQLGNCCGVFYLQYLPNTKAAVQEFIDAWVLRQPWAGSRRVPGLLIAATAPYQHAERKALRACGFKSFPFPNPIHAGHILRLHYKRMDTPKILAQLTAANPPATPTPKYY